ncbi:hypothetical protein WJX74_011060 [Apatococcus lobatus]|uniref:G domain-containing protein n=1 Tax=Apatococcus lobatus TaxID=904363 RepID=A0AAW1QVX5_9CHLO
MGKHNGKARSAGLKVGAALANRSKKGRPQDAMPRNHLYTTDPKPDPTSMVETNDLNTFLQMAELADRDFSAQRGETVVLSTGEKPNVDDHEKASARRAAELRNQHRLTVPRRPAWTADTTPAQLDHHERNAFLEWRRELAKVEEDEKLTLMPFEKNLDVWRQLWRVLERSHIVVQVVDARDPLLYRSEDLEKYCKELHPSKASMLLLNKADLLPIPLRLAWANYFDSIGLDYVFWSAKVATDGYEDGQEEKEKQEAGRARLVTIPELLDHLQEHAEAAATELAKDSKAQVMHIEGERLMVGLTGYPNVGKSSTINALFGAKKTAVAPTPGKTKHFQTLNVSERMTLCDCPGLVIPKYAASKAEMVAAGVLPIDRLTDVRSPVEVVAQRIPRALLEKACGLRLPSPAMHEPQDRAPTAAEVLRTWAVARGWTAASALPDEARAGRAIMKDYVAGRLLSCQLPPHASNNLAQLAVSATPGPRVSQAVAGSQALTQGPSHAAPAAKHDNSSSDDGDYDDDEEDDEEEPASASGTSSAEAGSPPTLVGASLDPTDQAAATSSSHAGHGSHEVGASVAGTADGELAEKLTDASPPPRGTLPETSSAGVLQLNEAGAKVAAAHGDAGAKRVQGHDHRLQEGLQASTTGHGGPHIDPAKATSAAGGNLHTTDIPAAAAPVVGSRHDTAQDEEVSGEDPSTDDEAEHIRDDHDDDMHQASSSNAALGSGSHCRLQERSGANPAQDGLIAEMGELALGTGSTPSSGRAAAPKRPSYKFQKKAARTKKRGQDGANGAFDGSGMAQGRRGGVVRA